ncbi:MAG: AAA family ATPase [Planctomycetes bacterium]|nr:AAA family ATPase [Planctomycetota bacterium]
MGTLHEKYRPKDWSEVVGQDEALAKIDRLRKSGGTTGRAWWIRGPSGTGKTTIARLLAQEVADPLLIDEADVGAVDKAYLAGIQETLRYKPLFGGAHVWIFNEAHRIRSNLVSEFLTMLDPVPPKAMYVFTTTDAAQKELWDKKLDAAPFLSRCEDIQTRSAVLEFARRAQAIAREVSLDGKPLDSYIRLYKRCRGSLRQMLAEIEGGAMLDS